MTEEEWNQLISFNLTKIYDTVDLKAKTKTRI